MIAKRPRLFWATTSVFMLISSAYLHADVFVFARGGKVQLPGHHVGKQWTLDTPLGPRAFLETDFSRVVEQPEPVQDWPTRLAKARVSGVDARFANAWWALENGLTREAVGELHAIHQDAPTHQPTASLCKTLEAVTPPCPLADTRDVEHALAGKFQTAKSPHFVLFHQGTEAEGRERLDLLENVYLTYYLVVSALGFALEPPPKCLMEAIFANETDYRDFLTRNNARAFLNTQGYYHPTLNLVATYRTLGLNVTRTNQAAIDQRRGELAALRKQVDRMPPSARLKIEAEGHPPQTATRASGTVWLAWAERDLLRQELLGDLDRRAIDLGIAAHETIHSLVANSKLAPTHEHFPTWFHEGFATQFEVIRGGRWAGVSRVHDIRMSDWRKNLPPPRVVEVLRDEGFGRGYERNAYASAWGLVYFLRKTHPTEFASYLDRLRTPVKTGGDRPRHPVETFQACFGADVRALEVEWHRYLRDLKTPLEDALASKP